MEVLSLPRCTHVLLSEESAEAFLVRQHFSIAHEKSQEGSKGGNGFFHVLGVLPVVGSKAIVNHFRLVNLQADGEGRPCPTPIWRSNKP